MDNCGTMTWNIKYNEDIDITLQSIYAYDTELGVTSYFVTKLHNILLLK